MGGCPVTQTHLDELKRGHRTFAAFPARGLVEYLDVNEENNSYIALYEREITKEHTHLEIEPFTLLGVCGRDYPVPAPQPVAAQHVSVRDGETGDGQHRVQPAQPHGHAHVPAGVSAKAHREDQDDRVDRVDDRLGAGQNATVAVMSYSGYDIEDAIVMNGASLDRGFGRCIVMRKYGVQIKKYSNRTTDRIVPPTPRAPRAGSTGRHRLLDKDGIAAWASAFHPGTCTSTSSPRPTRGILFPNPQAMPDRVFQADAAELQGTAGRRAAWWTR